MNVCLKQRILQTLLEHRSNLQMDQEGVINDDKGDIMMRGRLMDALGKQIAEVNALILDVGATPTTCIKPPPGDLL